MIIDAGLSPQRPRFNPRTVQENGGGQCGTGTSFLEMLWFFLVNYHSTIAPYSSVTFPGTCWQPNQPTQYQISLHLGCHL